MATVKNGTSFMVYVDGTAIGGSKSCKLSVNHDGRDTSTKDDAGWKSMSEGMRSWSVSVDGLTAFDGTAFTPDELSNLAINRTRVFLNFKTGVSGDAHWYGYAYLKPFDLNAPLEESVDFSVTFEGDGALSQGSHT